MIKENNYFKKLINGDIPLVITFWLWFVFLTILLNSFFDSSITHEYLSNSNFELSSNFIFYIFMFIYTIFIFVVVIRSANKYKGNKFFSFFSKVVVTMNLIIALFSALDLIKVLYFDDYTLGKEISNFQKDLPIKVNSYTLLENIYKEDEKIVYKYKLLNKNFQSYAGPRVEKFKNDVQNSLCEDENSLALLKKDYILNYEYVDVNNKTIVNIITNKKTCGPGIYDLDILREILKQETLS